MNKKSSRVVRVAKWHSIGGEFATQPAVVTGNDDQPYTDSTALFPERHVHLCNMSRKMYFFYE